MEPINRRNALKSLIVAAALGSPLGTPFAPAYADMPMNMKMGPGPNKKSARAQRTGENPKYGRTERACVGAFHEVWPVSVLRWGDDAF